MKRRLALFALAILVLGLWPGTSGAGLIRGPLPTPSDADLRSIILPPVPSEEQALIVEQGQVFMEILAHYATSSLNKPSDLRACAAEMLRMKPNEASCRDKHSVWFSRDDYQDTLAPDIRGKFGGVGLEVSPRDGKVVVVSPIDGTPAHRAGIKPEDVIVKVDGAAVADIRDAVKRMRGSAGAAVEITVDRAGKEMTFKVVREVITVHAVSSKVLPGPKGEAIGYLKIRTFSEILPDEFRKEMSAFRAQGISRVIFDLRNNPGGLMMSALEILYGFARSGDTLIVMRKRNDEIVFSAYLVKNARQLTGAPGEFRDFKAVVLVNKGSASASEIFAGTMKDWGYSVVGPPEGTFGKGIGQSQFSLSDGSTLSLTTFEYLVGNSRTKVDGVGVQPTHPVRDPEPSKEGETLSEEEQLKRYEQLKKEQLQKAIEILTR